MRRVHAGGEKAGLGVGAQRLAHLGHDLHLAVDEPGLVGVERGGEGQVFLLRDGLGGVQHTRHRIAIQACVALGREQAVDAETFEQEEVEISTIDDAGHGDLLGKLS